jgi:VanZ family protein
MSFSLKPRTLLILTVTAAYWLLIFGGTHAVGHAGPEVGNWDKLVHGGAFAGLALLLCGSLACFWRTRPLLYAANIAVVAGYGIVDELTQMLVKDRTADPLDWLADVTGAFAGTIVFALAAWLMRQRKKPQGATG